MSYEEAVAALEAAKSAPPSQAVIDQAREERAERDRVRAEQDWFESEEAELERWRGIFAARPDDGRFAVPDRPREGLDGRIWDRSSM